MLLQQEAVPNAVDPNCAVGDYGPTVGDMNKCYKTDPPKQRWAATCGATCLNVAPHP